MELVEKFDNKRRFLNKTEERFNIIPNEFKQSMHIWILNSKGELLIQKRNPNKKTYPGMWSITGGASDVGEDTIQTIFRECKEELAIDVDIDKVELIMTLKTKTDFTDIYLLKQDIDIDKLVLQAEEVTDAKWITPDGFQEMIDQNEVAPNIAFYYDFFRKISNI